MRQYSRSISVRQDGRRERINGPDINAPARHSLDRHASRIEMYQELILKSLIIGLIMALPTGPVGMLSVRRALAYGCRAGLASGIASS
ncbi:MAG: hypothetical protein ACREDR_29605, partial [Blastocatellia bacterium]